MGSASRVISDNLRGADDNSTALYHRRCAALYGAMAVHTDIHYWAEASAVVCICDHRALSLTMAFESIRPYSL
eukprot:6198146-Pleurochrysis_carterae.AAC.1